MGAWIETKYNSYLDHNYYVAPLWERGLKLNLIGGVLLGNASLPYGSVD